MTYTRTPTEYSLLRAEAERRVRAGEVRAAVARDLGLPYTTVSRWAEAGRWLRKDLDAENREKVEAIVGARLADMRARLAPAALDRAGPEAARESRVTPLFRRAAPAGPGGPAPAAPVMEYKSADAPDAPDAYDPFAQPPTDLYPYPGTLSGGEADRLYDVDAMRNNPMDAWLAANIAQTEAVMRYERGELALAHQLARFAREMYAVQKASDAWEKANDAKEKEASSRAWHARQKAARKASGRFDLRV